MRREQFLGVPLDIVGMNETVAWIDNRVAKGAFTQHVVVNVAKLVNMRKDKALFDSVTGCDLINVDGMGIVWGMRFVGVDIPERVAGVDLFHRLLKMSGERGCPVYLLGARPEIVEKTAAIVESTYPGLKIAGFHHGYFWEDETAVVEDIRQSGAKLLFVAITSPKKENFIHTHRDALGVSFVMGVGGHLRRGGGKSTPGPPMDAEGRTGMVLPASSGTPTHVETVYGDQHHLWHAAGSGKNKAGGRQQIMWTEQGNKSSGSSYRPDPMG